MQKLSRGHTTELQTQKTQNCNRHKRQESTKQEIDWQNNQKDTQHHKEPQKIYKDKSTTDHDHKDTKHDHKEIEKRDKETQIWRKHDRKDVQINVPQLPETQT